MFRIYDWNFSGTVHVVVPALLVGSIFIADRFGLVALIANGYRALSWVLLVVYVLPLLTLGVWWLWRNPRRIAFANR